ncbi:MAG: OmpH family outer membrane protein [Vicinamibacteria bacterium]|nr:OmpH family outer membrane protein [Vicinamibacteria bacterium]
MKTLPVWLAVTVLGAIAVGLAQPRAVTAPGPVAYVSSQRISNETADGKAGVARLQTLQRERAADVRTRQQALETTRQQMTLAKDDAARVRLRAQEQQQRTELERTAAQSQADFLSLQRQVSAEVATKVKAAVQEVVKGTEVHLVLNGESSVVWAAPGLDLTSAVIERMNAQPSAPRTP